MTAGQGRIFLGNEGNVWVHHRVLIAKKENKKNKTEMEHDGEPN